MSVGNHVGILERFVKQLVRFGVLKRRFIAVSEYFGQRDPAGLKCQFVVRP